VIGYEANGGFLLGFNANLPNGSMKALPTRDSLLPILAPLSLLITDNSLTNVVSKDQRVSRQLIGLKLFPVT